MFESNYWEKFLRAIISIELKPNYFLSNLVSWDFNFILERMNDNKCIDESFTNDSQKQ